MATYILRFADVRLGDIAKVGGKNASLGEMIGSLADRGIRVPTGFAVSADAYRDLIGGSGLTEPIGRALAAWKRGEASLATTGAAIRELILGVPLPIPVLDAIVDAYRALAREVATPEPAVAVRSSATAEDLPEASFAGQQESFLNVTGERQLIEACRHCYASLFTDRAIAYRDAKGIDQLGVALSIGIQEMVRSDIGASGVMFSLDPVSGFPRVIVINASPGLGEAVVQGAVDPDQYMLFKPLLGTGRAVPIIEKHLGRKEVKFVLDEARGGTRMIDTPAHERTSWALVEEDCVALARWGLIIEEHYGRVMDVEWAKDGRSGALFIVQARPATGTAAAGKLIHYKIGRSGRRLLEGQAVGTSIAAAKACVIRDIASIGTFEDGSILVTSRTDPDWTPLLKRAAAIVTEHGGTTSHAAIVSRELGIPAVVGADGATLTLRDGQEITVSCAEGETGAIYEGRIEFTREVIDASELPSTRTDLMLNLADPEQAFRSWQLPAKGVGLARMEFIISNIIRVHPMALVHPDRLSEADRKTIEEITRGYPGSREYFVDRLARGLGKLAAPYHPHIAIVRLSDFKTNEYAHLIGGRGFEPVEENPMLGFRGASRYYDPRYQEGFALECAALKRARETLGFTNIAVMIPFCRTTAEADHVLDVMAHEGLHRGEKGLQLYMMCEIPSNVIMAREFARRFDGFSIGSNDLTQLILGVDRDSEILAQLFDERDEAVTRSIASVIAEARACGIKIGICGEAPSNDPEFARFLVACGIDSMSLSPDSFVRTLTSVAEAEKAIRAKELRPRLERTPTALVG